MRNETRLAFNAYSAHLAQLNHVADAATKFAVDPTVAQTLEDRIGDSAEFLQSINVVPVDEQSGEKLGLGVSSPVASRTDTSAAERQPRNVADLDNNGYTCKQTNFDTYLGYAQMDAWAKFPDFQTRVRNHVTMQVARDRLMIGWNGESAAKTTDLAANPKLQDVNVGWLKHIRDDAPARVLTGVKVGDGGDYSNLDAAVFDAAENLLDDWYKDDPDIVAIVGRSLLSEKYLGLIDTANVPTEQNAMATLLLTKTLGGRKGIAVPYFPSASILITSRKNLSIYWQSGTHRRAVIDNPKRDRVEDFLSINEAYVVEDYGACAFLDGIQQPDGSGGWA